MSFLLPNTPSLADQLKLPPVKQETKTVTTMMARTDNDPFSQQDVKNTATAAMAANRQHEGKATTSMMNAEKLAADSEQQRKQYKQAGQQQLQQVKDKGTLLMQETKAKVDANQTAYKEFNDTVGSEEWTTSRTMMMKEMAARQQDLATAHNDLQNGGFLDTIGAAFRVAYHQERLTDLSQSVQQIQAAEMNAGQQLLMNLQKNAAAVGDIYAIEKQQNVNQAELSATLMKMAADGVQLNRDSMAEMASILGISSELANAKMKDFNVMIAANNASSSIFQTKLQELQAEQAGINLERTKKMYGEEKEADAWIQTQWESFAKIRGITDPGTFKQAQQVAESTKQPSPTLVQFGLYIGNNKDKMSLADAVLAKEGNAPLSDNQQFALSRGKQAVDELNREIAADNQRKAMERYPVPTDPDGKPVTVGGSDALSKPRNEYLAQLNAESFMSIENPKHIGQIEQRMKKKDAEYHANKIVAYNNGTIQDSPIEDVNAMVKTPGKVRDVLQSKLSPEVFSKLEKGEFGELSTTVEVGKDAATDTFNKLSYAVKTAAQVATKNPANSAPETVETMKARVREQAQVVAAGWQAKVQISPDYRNQQFTDAKMMLPVPSTDGSASSEMIEIDMTNPSAVYYYMDQLSKKSAMDLLSAVRAPGLGGR